MGFRETFTRTGEQDQNLQYDDTAFLYFSLSTLAIIVIPMIYELFHKIYLRNRIKLNDHKIIAEYQSVKKEQIKKITKNDYKDRYLLLRILVISILVFFLYENFMQLKDQKILKTFDPYETLEIDESASLREVKKAYRKLSLIYHPDKNPDDPLATAKFILITKAYNCLTDETMKELCQKYGNPDGKGSFNVAVALPSFLMKKENHVTVLIIFFITFLVIIPFIVYIWYNQQRNYDSDGILVENKQNYYQYLNENMLFKQIPEALATSLQFSDYPVTCHEEGQELQEMMEKVNSSVTKPKLTIQQMKPFLMISAHMLRKPFKNQITKDQQYRILKEAHNCMHDMIDFASKIPPQVKNLKYCGLRCIQVLIDFQQGLSQGLWHNSLEIEQLQFIDDEKIDIVVKKIKKVPKMKQLIQAYYNTEDLGTQKFINLFTPEQQKSLEKEITIYPDLKVEYKVMVENEKEIVEGDIVTINLQIYRMHLIKDADKIDLKDEKVIKRLKKIEQGYIHNPHSSVLQKEKLWVILGYEKNNIILFQKCIKEQGAYIDTSIKFRAPFEGNIKWNVYIRSDSYKGFDVEIPIDFSIKSEKKVKREIFVHPEDEALDREPTFMQQLMAGAGLNESEDELEDEEEHQRVQDKINRFKQQEEEQGSSWEEEEEEQEQEQEDIQFKKKK